MKLDQLVMRVAAVVAIATAIPSSAQAQLWYNGDFDGVNGLSSERNSLVSQSMVYDNFVVTGAGWTITSVFGNFQSSYNFTTADYEIRSGVSVGNGGSLLFSGAGMAASQVATGGELNGILEYTATISGLSIFLAPGTYWFGMSPVGSGSGRAFASTTGGTDASTAGNSFFNSTFFSSNFVDASVELGTLSDFAYGVDGRVGGGQDVVPEPATMTLLATGLAGMAAARRRKAARA